MANDWVAKHNRTVADREVKKAQARREERQRKLAGEQEPETPPEGEDEAFHQWLTDGGSEHDVEIELTEEQMAQIPAFSWPGGIPTPAYPLPPHQQRLLDQLTSQPAEQTPDMVNHPPHYSSPCYCQGCGKTIECIDITKHMNFRLGNLFKYVWRVAFKPKGDKFKQVEDLQKGQWYLNHEIAERVEDVVENE